MYAAFKGVDMPSANATLAEGIAVKQPGDLTVQIVKKLVNDVVLVSEGDIEQAIVMLLEIEKTVVEGAGATGLAAMMRHRERFAGRKVGLILCGGNIDPMVLADIIERGMVRAGRLARIRVHTRDVPGELARAATLIGQAGANIEEVEHQRAFTTLPVQNAELEFVLQTRGPEHIEEVLRTLQGCRASRHHASVLIDAVLRKLGCIMVPDEVLAPPRSTPQFVDLLATTVDPRAELDRGAAASRRVHSAEIFL